MSDNLAVLSRVIARLNAGVVLAALLLLAHGINISTECWGNDLSIAGNGLLMVTFTGAKMRQQIRPLKDPADKVV